MNKCKVLVFLLLMLFAPLILMTLDAYATAIVWTDKRDYETWETVTIYGSGFNPNTNIDITITKPDSTIDVGSTTSDGFGNFVYYYLLNGMFGTYTVAATDGVNSAGTTFLDTRYHLEGYTRLPHKKWTKGILKGWYECEEVPYRLKMIDVDATTYTISNYHDNDDGGVPGIDYCTGFYVGYTDGSVAPATEVTFSVTGPFYQTPVSITEIYHTWTVTYTSAAEGGTYYLYWKAHLAIGSSGWPGAKLHGKTDATGAQDVPIQTPPSAPIPPPPPAIHLDVEPPELIDPANPMGTVWHELYPTYCNWYYIGGWVDHNFNGVVDYCDYISLYDLGGVWWSSYHVEKVTVTLFLIPWDTGPPIYLEFEDTFWTFPFTAPISTWWHEVYPNYCNWYHLTSWVDNDLSGDLSPSDDIDLTDEFGEITWWYVEYVKTDLLVTKMPDFGDAPDPLVATPGKYPSLLASNGARHLDWNFEWLGLRVNGEADSKQIDIDSFDDGVSFTGSNLVIPGGMLQLAVTISTSGGPYNINDPNDVMYLNAWIDWNQDGDWTDTGEKIIGTGTPTGTQKFAGASTPVYNVPIPTSTKSGDTWLRFRLDYAEDAGVNPQPWTDPSLNQEKGAALYGEVEDYKITIKETNLQAVSQSATPGTVTQGDIVTVKVKVKNTGTTTETFDVDLKYDSTLLHTWTGITLGPGAQTELTILWDTTGVPPDTYDITAVVDPTDAIAETDETDNTCTVSAAVTVQGPPVQRNLQAVSQSATPGTVTQGDIVTVKVKVKNTGTTTETFDVDLKYDSTLLNTWTGITLGPGAQTELTILWDTTGVPPDTYDITAVVDPTDAIAETDETDNTCTVSAAVTICSPPTPPPSVGGEWVPINKGQLLVPWISLASSIMAAALFIVCVKHKRKQNN